MAIGNLLQLSAVVLAVILHGIQWNVDTMTVGKRHSTNKCLRKSEYGNSLI